MTHEGRQNHFLLVTFPAQGHINPAIQFAKRLLRIGAHVTFVTSIFAQRRMIKDSDSSLIGLNFAPFSDGYDDGFNPDDGIDHLFSQVKRHGSVAISCLVESFAKEGRPITCLIYTLLLPWAAELARHVQLPSALLWIQPATVFDIYYYYFSGYKEVILDNINDPSYSVQLPGLPLLKAGDLPSFFLPSNLYTFGISLFQEHFELLSQEVEPGRIFVNTFDELEPEALKAVDKFNLIGIGPLVPEEFLEGKSEDLVDYSHDYMQWLASKDVSSVVYISFGSFAVLSDKQMEELARGLVDRKMPFLWVIRSGEIEPQQVEDKRYRKILEEEHDGKVVPWCSQVEVLSHPSIGCFMTHCGWNSTLETLVMGVPVVAFPQWSDQGTNAKLIEDVWKIGVRVKQNEEDNIVKGEEIVRCLEEVMAGERGEELRRNAKKWKALTMEAVKEGGSSETNLRAFVAEVSPRTCAQRNEP
ncbi:hypothetical protein ACHQM5_027933 [Ranunculus cassubicifolius]